jgi:hypothetical protein
VTPLAVTARRLFSLATGNGYTDWLEPGDPEYPAAIARLMTHPEIVEFCDRITGDPEYGNWPTIEMCHNRDIELTWPNITAHFRHYNGEFYLERDKSEWSWTCERPDGRLVVSV